MKISEFIDLLKELPQDATLWFNYDPFGWYEPWIPELVSAEDAETCHSGRVYEGDYVISMG